MKRGGVEKEWEPRLCIQGLGEVWFKVGVFKGFGSGVGGYISVLFTTIFFMTFKPGSLQIRQMPNVNVTGTTLCPRSSSVCYFTPKHLSGYTLKKFKTFQFFSKALQKEEFLLKTKDFTLTSNLIEFNMVVFLHCRVHIDQNCNENVHQFLRLGRL